MAVSAFYLNPNNERNSHTMTREEHLAWAKERTIAELDAGSPSNAFASMVSDLGKHAELTEHIGIELGMRQIAASLMSTPDQYRKWINGFN